MSKEEKKIDRTEISELGEFGLIEHLTGTFGLENPSTIRGVGDDAAVIDNGSKLTVVSTDLLLEGIHFDLVYTPLKHLGYKSVIVNLSDIYAMNAHPKQITVSIGVSNRLSVEALTEYYSGVKLACELYGVDLVGGDTTTSLKGFIISITAIGEAEKKSLCYRQNAKEGDIICVSGDLAGAYLGLQLLEREKQVFLASPEAQPDLQGQDYIVGRFLKPEARKDIVEMFDQCKIKVNAMIDISDGLSSELFHISKQSEVGILIHEEKLPISNEASELALSFGLDPMVCALNGGEDYELLFTLHPDEYKKLPPTADVRAIGEITSEEEGKKIQTRLGKKHDLLAQGWKHIQDQE
jgi:thiamine-monophosphate kinase